MVSASPNIRKRYASLIKQSTVELAQAYSECSNTGNGFRRRTGAVIAASAGCHRDILLSLWTLRAFRAMLRMRFTCEGTGALGGE